METYLTLPGLFRGAAGARRLEAGKRLFDQSVVLGTGSGLLGRGRLSGPGAEGEAYDRHRTALLDGFPIEAEPCFCGDILVGLLKDVTPEIGVTLKGRRDIEHKKQVCKRDLEFWFVTP